MPTIMFQGKQYTIDTPDAQLQYFASGDLHGNDNFRLQNRNLTVYDALLYIDARLLNTALAANINDVPVALTKEITNDCTLSIITLDNIEGKEIYHNSLAFLIAQTIFTIYPTTQLLQIFATNEHCSLQFSGDVTSDLAETIHARLQQIIFDSTAIQIIDGFQKEFLIETFESLSSPYAKAILARYDDFDFVPIGIRKNFVLPVSGTLPFMTNSHQIVQYTLSLQLNPNGFSINAQLTT